MCTWYTKANSSSSVLICCMYTKANSSSVRRPIDNVQPNSSTAVAYDELLIRYNKTAVELPIVHTTTAVVR